MSADEALGRWCERWLGSAVSEVVFRAGSLSTVVGVRLTDGREVVVKVRPPSPRLPAAYAVHRYVWRSGYPAPEPLVPPTPFGARTASAERLVRGGEIGGAADAARSAEALAALIAVTASAGDVDRLDPSPSWVAWDHDEPGPWPEPGLNRVAGPDWLDDAAARCRARLRRYAAPLVIGHADWHADNVLWSAGRLLVVHDWDSVVRQPEAVIAGIAAAIFPASGAAWQPATVAESERFLSAYVGAGTRAWTADDIEAFWAASAWTLAVDAKEAVSGGAAPDLTEAETAERLALAGA